MTTTVSPFFENFMQEEKALVIGIISAVIVSILILLKLYKKVFGE